MASCVASYTIDPCHAEDSNLASTAYETVAPPMAPGLERALRARTLSLIADSQRPANVGVLRGAPLPRPAVFSAELHPEPESAEVCGRPTVGLLVPENQDFFGEPR